jgi:hypothetical protein
LAWHRATKAKQEKVMVRTGTSNFKTFSGLFSEAMAEAEAEMTTNQIKFNQLIIKKVLEK